MTPRAAAFTARVSACIALSRRSSRSRSSRWSTTSSSRLVRAMPSGGQHRFLLRGAAQPAEPGHQLADGAHPAELAVAVDRGRDQPLEAVEVVPVRRRGSDGRHRLQAVSVGS